MKALIGGLWFLGLAGVALIYSLSAQRLPTWGLKFTRRDAPVIYWLNTGVYAVVALVGACLLVKAAVAIP